MIWECFLDDLGMFSGWFGGVFLDALVMVSECFGDVFWMHW